MWQRIRQIGIEFYCFLTAPLVLKNCLGMTAFLATLFFLTFFWLKCFTRHGESMEVPNYQNLLFREAERKAEARGFRVAVSDSIFKVGAPAGMVLSQNPLPGQRVKEDRTLYFQIAKNNPDVVKLPSLAASDDYEVFARALQRLDLKPRVLARVADDKLEENTILQVLWKGDTVTGDLKKGIFVEKGSVIDLIVSQKEAIAVNVPDCVCQTFDGAKFILSASNLNLGTVVADQTVTDRESAYVWRQSPRFDPRGKMRAGQSVDIWLTQNRPKGCAGDETDTEPEAAEPTDRGQN